MKKRILLFLLCFVAAYGVQAQGKKIEFEEFTLDNGLHVILHRG